MESPRDARRPAFLAAALLALASLALTPVAASAAGGLDAAEVTIGTGTAAHPLGFAEDEDTAYLFQSALLAVTLGESSAWRLVYEGTAYQFGEDAPLDQMRHALGVERIGTVRDGAVATRAGLQAAGRFHLDALYDAYDSRQLGGYLAAKGWASTALLLRGEVSATWRDYPDLPEESWVEANAAVEAQRFFATRTTVSARAEWGGKWFPDPAADGAWGEDVAAAQARLRLHLAQGLSDRLGVQATGRVRLTLRDFPYVVREDLYDSPLLDSYASSGWSARTAARVLVPWQTWLEVGGSLGSQDFGAMLFPGDAGSAERSDDLASVFGSLERVFSAGERSRLRAGLEAGWYRQSSSLARYDLSGVDVVTSLRWSW